MWLTKRTVKYGFAAKAGHNAEMHNHNDVGSFIFAKGGRQLLMDVGAGVYTRQYFSSERYNIFEPSSRGHSVPIINGEYQPVGISYAATDVVYRMGHFSMDIAGAYKVEGVRSIKRTFFMDDDKVVMTDAYDVEAGNSIVERIVTLVKPAIQENGTVLIGDCRLSWYGDAELQLNTEECANGTCYLLDFTVREGEKEFKIVME